MVTMSNNAKVYIGELGNDGSQTELEDAFSYYGPIKSVWVARSPPGFAFVEFEDPRDARDSIRGLDGRMLCGHRVTVEMADGRGKNRSSRAPAYRSTSRSYDPNDRCYECGERGHYAYDCRYRRRQGVRRSRSRSRGYDRRRSLSRDKRSRSYSRSRTPERRSRSPRRNGRD